MGKFVIRPVPSGMRFDLKAGNGEVIATSEVYKARSACRSGVRSVMKNAAAAAIEDQTEAGWKKEKNPKFEVYPDETGAYRFRLQAINGQKIIVSKGYADKAECLSGIERIKKNAAGAAIVEIDG